MKGNRMFAVLASLGLASCNVPPSAPIVSIDPGLPTTEDDLALVVSEEALDPNGDPLEYQVTWLRSGEVQEELTDWTVDASFTTRGETWEVRVKAFDGKVSGPQISASVEVGNSPPVVSWVALEPEEPLAADDLVATFAVEDADGDPVATDLGWTVNGLQTWHESATLPAHATRHGDEWAVWIIADDGVEESVPSAAGVVIGNTAPPAPTAVQVEPSAPVEGDELVCVIEGASVDEDGETIVWTVQWLVDSAIFGSPVSTSYAGDTVPSATTLEGETWSCAATGSDGTEDSGSLGSDPVTIGPAL